MPGRPFFACLLLIPAISISSRACTCSDVAPGRCPGLEADDVVFLGTVTLAEDIAYAAPQAADVAAAAPNSGANPAPIVDIVAARLTRYRFRIDERFAPATPSAFSEQIDVFSGGQDGDCGYRFKAGQQYVVYTHPGTDGRLFATICSGTRPASEARALLPQLRAMRDGRRVASVFGVLRKSEPPFLALPEDPEQPLANIPLRLRSHDDRFETSSDADGVYTFYDVHAGEYSFTARLPVRMELTHRSLTGGLAEFRIPNGACYEFDLNALPTGHIRGSVLGPNGKPLPIASVELYRAGTYSDTRPGLWGFQGAEGVFDLDHVGAGNYTLVFNRENRSDPNSPYSRTFYPGVADLSQAQMIQLKDGQQLTKVNFTVTNGYPTHLLRVQLKWQGVRPPGSVTVTAVADDGQNPSAQKVADGVYQLTLLETTKYKLSAWEDLAPRRAPPGRRRADCTLPPRIEAEPVVVAGADTDTKEVTLTLTSAPCEKPSK